ncbi:hypothetical protein MNBD_BACTEROID03-2799, partial [hydrothermal vent metagenome]
LDHSVLDSMPIITCSGKRQGKVAKEITSKGYCPTKSMYYHGMKLHALGYRHIGKLPHPEQILLTPASVNDLSLYKEAWSEIKGRTFFGDKIYMNEDFFKDMRQKYNSEMLDPRKSGKGNARGPEEIRQGGERPVFKGSVQNKTAHRGIVQLADRKGRYSKSKQGSVDQRSNATCIRKVGRRFYNTDFQPLIRISYYQIVDDLVVIITIVCRQDLEGKL